MRAIIDGFPGFRPWRPIGILAALGLAACQAAQTDIAGAAQVALDTLNIACREGSPVAAALAATQDKTAGSYLSYFGSVCDPVTGTALPGVTPDKNTGIWAAALTGALK